jgi:hypothetical protein
MTNHIPPELHAMLVAWREGYSPKLPPLIDGLVSDATVGVRINQIAERFSIPFDVVKLMLASLLGDTYSYFGVIKTMRLKIGDDGPLNKQFKSPEWHAGKIRLGCRFLSLDSKGADGCAGELVVLAQSILKHAIEDM